MRKKEEKKDKREEKTHGKSKEKTSHRIFKASAHLYKRSCPSVRRSICRSVSPSVGPSIGLSVHPSVRPVLFSKVISTHTRRILCHVSGLVYMSKDLFQSV